MIALHAQFVAQEVAWPETLRRECKLNTHFDGSGSAIHRIVWLWYVAAVAFVVLMPAWPSRADEDDDDAPAPAAARQISITEQNFDQMVFGATNRTQVVVENGVRRVTSVSGSGSPAENARKRMESAIDAEMQWLAGGCRLTESQKKKLRLAGRGDIGSFFSRAEELRAKVVGRALDQQEYSELSMEMSLLRMASQNGLLNDTSLFRKTLRRTLDDQQRAEFQRLLRQRQLEAAEAGVVVWERVTTNGNGVKAIGLKLSSDTRRKVCELIVEQGRLPESTNPYMRYIVLLEADRLADNVRPLMNDEQWEEFQKLVEQAKRVEPSIRRYAQWPPVPVSDDDETKD